MEIHRNYCVECGKPVDPGEILCKECKQKKGVTYRYKPFQVMVCKKCGRIRISRWGDTTKSLTRYFKPKPDDISLDIEGDKAIISVSYQGFTDTIEQKIVYTTCPDCSRIQGGYYEAILQLRPADKVAMYWLERLAKDKTITRKESLREGIDYYFYKWREAIALARELKKRVKGKIKVTRKLHTYNHQTSKRVYRVTVSFRVIPE